MFFAYHYRRRFQQPHTSHGPLCPPSGAISTAHVLLLVQPPKGQDVCVSHWLGLWTPHLRWNNMAVAGNVRMLRRWEKLSWGSAAVAQAPSGPRNLVLCASSQPAPMALAELVKVQKWATKMIKGMKCLPQVARLKCLALFSLEEINNNC